MGFNSGFKGLKTIVKS